LEPFGDWKLEIKRHAYARIFDAGIFERTVVADPEKKWGDGLPSPLSAR